MDQRAEGRGTGARAEHVGKRQHTNRRDPQNPADHHQHHVRDCLEKAGQARARFGGQTGEGEGEQGRENDERENRVVRSGGDRVRGNDRADEISEAWNRLP